MTDHDAQGPDDFGTTAGEQRLGDTVADRTGRESSDILLDEPETDAGLVADDTPSAEEAAVHVEEEPAGLNYDADPGYLRRP